jgi:hypothetical protein
MAMDVDVRDVLPAIRVPTLVLNMADRRGEAEYVTARIPGARSLQVSGPDYLVTLLGEEVYDEVERFVRSVRDEMPPETVLATILFTDIVRSTDRVGARRPRPGRPGGTASRQHRRPCRVPRRRR